MATAAELRQRLADIDEILATGITSSSGDGQSTTFDLKSLREEREDILVKLGQRPRRRRVFRFRQGHGFPACILILLGFFMSVSTVDTFAIETSHTDGTRTLSDDLFFTAGADTYDALKPDGKRRISSGHVRHEDRILTQQARRRLASNAQDLHRNLILVAWMIRRHLDFVTKFNFQACTKDDGLNRDINALIAREQKARFCDFGQRHSWGRLRRIAEVRKILDGDCGFLKIRGGFVQGFESHQIRNPSQKRRDERQWRHGIKLGAGERALAYCFHGTDLDGKSVEQIRRAGDVMLLAEYMGRMQQTRGASPVFAAQNDCRDLYETFDLVRERIKIEQIFGVGFIRKADAKALDDDLENEYDAGLHPGETADQPDTSKRDSYDIGGGVRGFDLDEGEDIKILQGNAPGANSMAFLNLQIMMICKSLDLPFSFFDESFTNFHGALRAWHLYERACDDKREGQQELNEAWTQFKLFRLLMPKQFGGTAELILPSGMSMEDVSWKWVPMGMPWWKPETELQTDILAVATGLKTFQDVCDERHLGNWRENVLRRAAEDQFAREAGATIMFNPAKLPASISFTTDTTQAA